MNRNGRRNIVLTGFMGTGKSAVGKALAERSGRDFVDLDEAIVAAHGQIATIFAEEGEERFRELEAETATEIAAQRNLVISTGGGTMTNPDNVATFLSADIFTLTADPTTILSRIEADGIEQRPLLADAEDPAAEIERLLEERADAYEKFTQIDTTDMTIEEVVDSLVEAGVEVDLPEGTLTERAIENRGDARETLLGVVAAGLAVVVIILLVLLLTF